VGLPDAAVKESKDRVISALQSCGLRQPEGATLVNLAPADRKKEGASFDLPIAMALLAAIGKADRNYISKTAGIGELALDGSLRPVKGVLPAAMHMGRNTGDIQALIVPYENAEEAATAAGNLPIIAVRHLSEALDFLNNGNIMPYKPGISTVNNTFPEIPDFRDVKGQILAKRALEIAATGGHNVLMVGPPGSGKSMLAKRLPGILPPMNIEETLETSKIHSILGLLSSGEPILNKRPFRSPHHTISDAGLLGGGSQIPVPGEISLANNGVLFLDELPEFKRNVLEVLRQPLENGQVTISRAAGSFNFPARFILVAAMNPCPCGHYGNRQRECRCGPNKVNRYRSKISGPLLDRIDIHVEVGALNEDELISVPAGEDSSTVRQRVLKARSIQEERFKGTTIHCNSQMEASHIQRFCELDRHCRAQLRHSIRELQLSARAYDRILKTARTIADLEGTGNISSEHLYESVQYRSLDRRLW
jgi:magnesium chelatase family protein